MTTEQRPATDLLIIQLAETVQQVRDHEHPERGEDLYCLNLHAYMGERMAAVLKRLADTQAEVRSWKDRHTALADEASNLLSPPDTEATIYVLPDSPKMLRETLCIAQTRIGNSIYEQDRAAADIARLQRLIDECDRHRPLGPDGKHGDLHTPTCGCEDA
jgi:hypothetical protein